VKKLLIVLALVLPAAAWAEVGMLSLYPGIGSDAHYKHWQRFGLDRGFPTYTLEAVHEPQPPDYVGPTEPIPPGDPILSGGGDFVKLPNGRYQVQFALNRLWGVQDYRESVFFGLADSLQRFNGLDVYSVVSLNLVGAVDAPPERPLRVLIGASFRAGGNTRFVEISLYSHGWERCTPTQNLGNPWGAPTNPGPCDTANLYDLRSWWAVDGELVAYSVPGLPTIGHAIPPLVNGGGWTQYFIDWGKLIRTYPWKDPIPADARVEGVYVGIESLTGTWAYLQVRDFTTWGM